MNVGYTIAYGKRAYVHLQIKMGDDDMTVVCTIIATAEYCSEVVGSLGRSIAKTLEPPYNEQVRPCSSFIYDIVTSWQRRCTLLTLTQYCPLFRRHL